MFDARQRTTADRRHVRHAIQLLGVVTNVTGAVGCFVVDDAVPVASASDAFTHGSYTARYATAVLLDETTVALATNCAIVRVAFTAATARNVGARIVENAA
jgi:hypothetical protein